MTDLPHATFRTIMVSTVTQSNVVFEYPVTICNACGSMVQDTDLHLSWHNKMIMLSDQAVSLEQRVNRRDAEMVMTTNNLDKVVKITDHLTSIVAGHQTTIAQLREGSHPEPVHPKPKIRAIRKKASE